MARNWTKLTTERAGNFFHDAAEMHNREPRFQQRALPECAGEQPQPQVGSNLSKKSPKNTPKMPKNAPKIAEKWNRSAENADWIGLSQGSDRMRRENRGSADGGLMQCEQDDERGEWGVRMGLRRLGLTWRGSCWVDQSGARADERTRDVVAKDMLRGFRFRSETRANRVRAGDFLWWGAARRCDFFYFHLGWGAG